MRSLEGKIALVTGGGGDIGQAAALILAREGATVVVSDTHAESGEVSASKVIEKGGRAQFIQADVTDSASVNALMATIVKKWGRLDCAFNNAGINLVEDNAWEIDAFEKLLAVNTTGVMKCMKAEIEVMLAQGGGSIVNNSSTFGLTGSSAQPGYAASKHAVVGLTRTGALRYARNGIRMNVVCPGPTRSAMTSRALALGDEIRLRLENMAPMGRLCEPEEVAEAAVWLLSPKASFITGEALAVDGGFLAY